MKINITWSGIVSIFRKEMIQLLRDKYLLAFIIALPIAQLLVTGLAIQKDLNHVPTVVCNYDNRNASQELLKALHQSRYFDIEPDQYVSTDREVVRLIGKGMYRVGVIIPPDYSRRLLSGDEPPSVRVVVDGSNGNIAKSVLDAAQVIVSKFAIEQAKKQLLFNGDATGSTGGLIGIETQVISNPELKTSYFLIPAILSLLMHMLTILFTSFTIVRERETGTLEQLMVTPIRKFDLMVGKVIPYTVIGLFDMLLTLGVMVWFFDIPISGSFGFLLFASMIFITTSLAIGLLISTSASTQVQAIQVTVAILIPSMILTGFVFPLEPMPWVVKIFSFSLPLTYYLEIIRGVVIKGIGFSELWQQTTILALMSAFFVTLSIFRFKKQVA